MAKLLQSVRMATPKKPKKKKKAQGDCGLCGLWREVTDKGGK